MILAKYQHHLFETSRLVVHGCGCYLRGQSQEHFVAAGLLLFLSESRSWDRFMVFMLNLAILLISLANGI